MKKIYEAQICKFESIEKTDLSLRYIIDESSIKTIFGEKKDDKIIDFYTGKTYHILKRNNKVYIASEEEIELNKYYVNKIKQITMLEYLRKLKNKLIKGKQKIKTY